MAKKLVGRGFHNTRTDPHVGVGRWAQPCCSPGALDGFLAGDDNKREGYLTSYHPPAGSSQQKRVHKFKATVLRIIHS
eukprot:3729391-Amphidinium_carterae.1